MILSMPKTLDHLIAENFALQQQTILIELDDEINEYSRTVLQTQSSERKHTQIYAHISGTYQLFIPLSSLVDIYDVLYAQVYCIVNAF